MPERILRWLTDDPIRIVVALFALGLAMTFGAVWYEVSHPCTKCGPERWTVVRTGDVFVPLQIRPCEERGYDD